jgi:carboxylate-amine ligase
MGTDHHVDVDRLLDVDRLRACFDSRASGTIGIEEEILLLDPVTYAPASRGDEVVEVCADERIKRELPACQVEIATRPWCSVEDAVTELDTCRARIRDACDRLGVVAAAGAVHPRVAMIEPSSDERHLAIEAEYGEVARRQLVGALQVHVALGSADRSLAVYNAVRSHLPEIAALAASAPFYEGRDTGFASVRPIVSGQLPRQGVPPAFESWEHFSAELAWGRASGAVPEPRRWWWEVRPHVVHGTIEVRVADVQATTNAAAAITGVIDALVRRLAAAYDDGRPLAVDPVWRIAENRWRALRDGVHGRLLDLRTGEERPTSDRLHRLLDEIEPHAAGGLDAARSLVSRNGADALREVGPDHAAAWLGHTFSTSHHRARKAAPA